MSANQPVFWKYYNSSLIWWYIAFKKCLIGISTLKYGQILHNLAQINVSETDIFRKIYFQSNSTDFSLLFSLIKKLFCSIRTWKNSFWVFKQLGLHKHGKCFTVVYKSL